MKKSSFFSLLLVIAFTNCARHNDNTVTIHSVPADSIFTEIRIIEPTTRQTMMFEGGSTHRFEIDTVDVRGFYGMSSNGYFRTQLFITPSDSVSFKTIAKDKNSYDVIFEGKNAAHYNYASKKKNVFPWEEEPNYDLGMDLLEYKRQLQDYRDRENEFLHNYKKEHTVSNDFINYASAEISNLYALKLYLPIYFNKCKIKIPEGYLDDAVITQNSLSFYAFEALLFKYIYCVPDENIERIYNEILDKVSPVFQSRLLSEVITHFAQKGDRAYKKSLLQVMDKIEKTATDSTLLAVVQEYRPFYLLTGTVLPHNILDKTYLRSFQSDKKITLSQFFNNYKNTAIFLDFWASWCGPCRSANRASVENKPYFSERNIAVVYISVDEDESAWLQAAKDDRITENQYLLLDADNSPLNAFLKVRKGGVPRYVLFNKNHEIEILSAPRPVDCAFVELKTIIERNPEKFISERPVVAKSNNIAKKSPIYKDCADTTKFFIKTIYHDTFGTFSNATNYVDAWGTPRTPAKNWQTKYSPYTIPRPHKMIFGSPDVIPKSGTPEDGFYTIGALKKGVMVNFMRGGMTEDASGDPNGAVLCINVAKNYKGEIYRHQIDNLSSNEILYFEVSIANASFPNNTTPPQVEIRIETTNGKLLGNAHSNLTSETFGWQKVHIDVPPTKESSVVLRVISTGEDWMNGCDLLMDDIIFRVCSQR